MEICKGKLSIELEENIVKLEQEIEQLRQLKKEIVQSSTYYLLDGKTQMIDEKNGKEIRSRMEHTNNVASIAKRIMTQIYDLCADKELCDTNLFKLNKERAVLYTEVTALLHDLGHTPFGHAGEAVVNEFIKSIEDKETIKQIIQKRKECFGKEYEEEQGHTEGFDGQLSFEHNEQSALEFYEIIQKNPDQYNKVDTEKIIKGILSHSISRVPEVPKDLIAQIIRQTDKIEYRNKDNEEIMEYIQYNADEQDLLEYQSLSANQRIEKIITDIANEAIQKGKIDDDNEAMKMCKRLRKKYENIVFFLDKEGKRGLLTGDNRERQQMICKKLLEYYYQHPEKIPTKSMAYNHPINEQKPEKRVIAFDKRIQSENTEVEMAIKYVNTFTNKKCMDTYRRLVKERAIKGKGYGIDPITEEEIEKRKQIQIEEQVAKIKAKDIYKGRETHTDQEYIKMLERKNERFMKEEITPQAKEVILNNRKKFEKDRKEDEMLWGYVIKADEERKNKKEQSKEKMKFEQR